MCGRRLLGLVTLLGALAAFAAAPAVGARPASGPGTSYPETLTTEHFQIHYTGKISNPANKDRILHQQAGDLAAHAERAYDVIVRQWGYPAPKADADGKIDIWVQKQDEGTYGYAVQETAAPSTGWISLSPTSTDDPYAIAHEVFHIVQYGMWRPADTWLLEATAEWAGMNVSGFVEADGTEGAPDLSLDCTGDACGDDGYENGGYSRWRFFQYLSDRFGVTFVRDLFQNAAAIGDAGQKGRLLLEAALVKKGHSLTDTFNDFTSVHVSGKYAPVELAGKAPAVWATLPVATATKTYPAKRVPVNHLAARYLEFDREDGGGGQCYAATLRIDVTLPAGSESKPSFWAKSIAGSLAAGQHALQFSTSTQADGRRVAGASIPWSTCEADGNGYLALPNPSPTADAQVFIVNYSITVGNVSLTPPSTPPAPAYTGPATAVPTKDPAPAIWMHGAEVVRVPATTRTVRLLVNASSDGFLRAMFDGVVVATAPLRAGTNDVRFTLPVTVIKAVKSARSRAAGRALSLTSLAPDGTAGETVTRQVLLVEPKAQAEKKAAKKLSKKAGRR